MNTNDNLRVEFTAKVRTKVFSSADSTSTNFAPFIVHII